MTFSFPFPLTLRLIAFIAVITSFKGERDDIFLSFFSPLGLGDKE